MKPVNKSRKGPKRLVKSAAKTRQQGTSRPPRNVTPKPRPARRLHIPPALLEDDPVTPPETPPPHPAESVIPGCSLFLEAVDPFTVYGYWFFDRELSPNPRETLSSTLWQLRIQRVQGLDKVAIQQTVALAAGNCFVSVPHAGSVYVGELGYGSPAGAWIAVATSLTAATPPVAVAEASRVELARVAEDQPVPLPAPSPDISKPDAQAHPAPAAPSPAIASAISPSRSQATDDLFPIPRADLSPATSTTGPEARKMPGPVSWVAAQQPAGPPAGSGTQPAPFTTSAAPPTPQAPLPGLFTPLTPTPDWMAPLPTVSSEAMKEMAPKPTAPFWFNANAELIIYGATEPTATVRLGAQPLTLREDGTFSLRIDLPDGAHELVLSAISASGHESRTARLCFHRQTIYHATNP